MAAMQVIEETQTKLVLEMDPPQARGSSMHGLGCSGIVLGITLVLIVIFRVFGYPYYNTPHSWLFWVVTAGVLFVEAFVIYVAAFISRVINTGMKKLP
jgi:hypothetical protein